MKKTEKIKFLQGYLNDLINSSPGTFYGMCPYLLEEYSLINSLSLNEEVQYKKYIYSIFFKNKSYIKKLIIDENYINSKEKINVHMECINSAYKEKWTSYYLMPQDKDMRIKFVKYLLKKLKQNKLK